MKQNKVLKYKWSNFDQWIILSFLDKGLDYKLFLTWEVGREMRSPIKLNISILCLTYNFKLGTWKKSMPQSRYCLGSRKKCIKGLTEW